MLPRLLLLLLLVTCGCQASHFFGTVATYTPKETAADGSVTVVLRYKSNFDGCGYLIWQCLSGDCGSVTEQLRNTILSKADGEWCQTEQISTRLVPSNAPFELWVNSGNWISNIINGIVNWRAVILVELRNRSDTNLANRSPQTTVLPLVRVPSNCPRDFDLLAFDPDGDEVQCRHGNASEDECNPCTPPSVLNLTAGCTLSFGPTNSSSEGPYAVQLMMEDFPRQTITLNQTNGTEMTVTPNDAISKIPVQFVVRVDPAVPSCTDGLYLPKFLPPTPDHGARLYTNVSQTLQITVSAEANISSVSTLLFSGPSNTTLQSAGSGLFTLSWTPAEQEDGENHPICFVVEALANLSKYHSDLRCVIVTVGEATASSRTTTVLPAIPLPPPTTTTTATTTTPPPPTTTTPSTTTTTPPPTTTSPSTTTTSPPTTTPPITTLPPTTTPTTTIPPTTTTTLPPTTTPPITTLPPTTTIPPTTTTTLPPTTTPPPTTTTTTPPPTTTTPTTTTPPPTTTATTRPTTTSPTTTTRPPTTTTTTPPTTTSTTPPPTTTTPHPTTSTTTATTPPPTTTTRPPTTTTTTPPPTPTPLPPAPPILTPRTPYFLVGLQIRISTPLVLSDNDFVFIGQQLSNLLESEGLPPLTVNKVVAI